MESDLISNDLLPQLNSASLKSDTSESDNDDPVDRVFMTLNADQHVSECTDQVNDSDLEHPHRTVSYSIGKRKFKKENKQTILGDGKSQSCFSWMHCLLRPARTQVKRADVGGGKREANCRPRRQKIDSGIDVTLSPVESTSSFITAPNSFPPSGPDATSPQTENDSPKWKTNRFPRIFASVATGSGAWLKRNNSLGVPSSSASSISSSSTVIIKRGILAGRSLHSAVTDDKVLTKGKQWANYAFGWRLYEVILKPKQLLCFANEFSKPALIPLHDASCTLSMYTQIDTVLVLTVYTKKNRRKVSLILKAMSTMESLQWYMAINAQLEKPNVVYSSEISVWVPEEKLQLAVHLPVGSPELSGSLSVWQIRDKVVELLQKQHNRDTVLDAKSYTVTWKRLERVYWSVMPETLQPSNALVVNPRTIENSHRLEIRKIEHAGDSVQLPNGTELTAPPEVQGLILKRCPKHPYVHKYLRFAIVRGPLLFTTTPRHAARVLKHDRPQGVLSSDPLYNLGATKLGLSTLSAEQSARIVAEATECIDLRHVIVIATGLNSYDVQYLSSSHRFTNLRRYLRERYLKRHSERVIRDSECMQLSSEIVLVLNNGSCVSLEAASQADALVWINLLRHVIVYWKAHAIVEFDKQARSHQANFTPYKDWRVRQRLEAPHLRSGVLDDEARIRAAYNLNSSEMLIEPNPSFLNVCLYRQCYFTRKESIVYVQMKPNKPFISLYCVLIPGHLMFFAPGKTSKLCNERAEQIASCHPAPLSVKSDGAWRRVAVVKLSCFTFVFSGSVSSQTGREDSTTDSSVTTKLITLPESYQYHLEWPEFIGRGVGGVKTLQRQLKSMISSNQPPRQEIKLLNQHDSAVDLSQDSSHPTSDESKVDLYKRGLHELVLQSKTAFVVSEAARTCSFSLFVPDSSRCNLFSSSKLNSYLNLSGTGRIISFRSAHKSDSEEWITALQVEIESLKQKHLY